MNEQVQRMLADAAERVTQAVATHESAVANNTQPPPNSMSRAEGEAFMRDLNAEAAMIVLTTTAPPARNDPRTGPPVQKDEIELYADSMRREGKSEREILGKLFSTDPPERTAAANAEKATQQRHLDEQAAAKYAATPEGLREEAQAQRAAQAVRASMLADADTLLQSRGLTEQDLRQLTENERLRFSGVNPEATDVVKRPSGSSMLVEGSDVSATEAAREIAAQAAEGSEGQ